MFLFCCCFAVCVCIETGKIIPVNDSKFIWISCQCIGHPFTLFFANSCLTHLRHGMVVFLKSIICCFTFMDPVLRAIGFCFHCTSLNFKIYMIISIFLSLQFLVSYPASCLASNSFDLMICLSDFSLNSPFLFNSCFWVICLQLLVE